MALLILAIIVGLAAGLARAQLNHRHLRIPPLRQLWLVLVAFAAQAVVFQIPGIRQTLPDPIASGIFIGSQLLLLWFIWRNRLQPGFWSLGAGLILNLIAICLNGGWMPVGSDTLSRLIPLSAPGTYQLGKRFGFSKDLVLEASDIHFGFLADRFILPAWVPYRVAFSIGDVLIAIGAFLLLWSIGSSQDRSTLYQNALEIEHGHTLS